MAGTIKADAGVAPPRVVATPAALALLAEIQAEHGPVLFHQSGGCCDGSSPMCYPAGDFRIGDRDVLLGELAGAPVYIGGDQFELWKHTQLLLDVVPGRGGMFSLDNGREQRFLVRGRVFSAGEQATLEQRGSKTRSAEAVPPAVEAGTEGYSGPGLPDGVDSPGACSAEADINLVQRTTASA